MSVARKGKNGWRSIWAAYRYRARAKGFKWTLTEERFYAMLKQPCHYCGDEPTELNESNVVTVNGLRHFYSGVDRIRNKPIYSARTTVPCCASCNTMKGTKPRQEFLKNVRKIETHSRRASRT